MSNNNTTQHKFDELIERLKGQIVEDKLKFPRQEELNMLMKIPKNKEHFKQMVSTDLTAAIAMSLVMGFDPLELFEMNIKAKQEEINLKKITQN